MSNIKAKVLLVMLVLLCVVPIKSYAKEDENTNNGEIENSDGTIQEPEEDSEEEKKEIVLTNLKTTAIGKNKVKLSWDYADGAIVYLVYKKNGNYNLMDTVTTNYYVDENAIFGKSYYYKVVPVGENEIQGVGKSITFINKTIVNVKKQKYTYKELKEDVNQLKNKYSQYCTVTAFGTSENGRTLYDVAIGNKNAKKAVLVVGTIHGREYVCSVLLMREIEYYLSNYNNKINGIKPSDVLKNVQIHYVVMANPDGVTISQTSYKRWKANAKGVDLNRNFPYLFHVAGKKGAEGYTGKKALSEKESKALANLTKELKKNQNLCSVINYHAMGKIVFGSYGGKDSKIKKEIQGLYWLARKETGYKDAGDYGSVGKGCYREYVMYVLKVPTITLELGKTWCPVAYSEYNSIFKQNKMLVLKAAKRYN